MLGVDVGTEYIKAVLVKPGIPLEIVLTKDSKRKETSALAFKSSPHGPQSDDQLPERLYGGDALALSPRIPSDVFPNLKHLLAAGLPGRETILENYKARYPALDTFQHSNGTLGFRSKSFGAKDGSYSVEELLGMELRSIRENAESMAGSAVKDVVITVPAYYTADERRAMEFAAQLAGLRVLGLISDGVAVGLNYATTRTFGNVDEGGKAEYHLVYDMGAGSTTATVLRMQGRRVKDVGRFNKTIQEVSTVGVGWDRTLGGDSLNDLIVNDMVEKFVDTSAAKKLNIEAASVKSHGRRMAKLWKESERLRQILSANSASSSFFEGLYEDVDFRYKLSRADFEAMASDFRSRVSSPISDALASAGMTFEDISSVILHGGAVRTPFVQNSLEAVAGGPTKLKSNVNADEAAVFGAAFKAAGLSPSFRVKEIHTIDTALYTTTLHWTANGKDRTQQIFVPTSQTGAAKQMPFNKIVEDFTLHFRQKVLDVDLPVLEVKTTNLTASVAKLILEHDCVKENVTTLLSFRIDPATGIPEITKGSVTCESTTLEKKGVMDGVKGMLGFGKKDQKTLSEDDDVEILEPYEETSSETSKTSSSTTTTSTSGKGTETSPAPAKKTHVINLSFSSSSLGLAQPTGPELQRIKDGLAQFDKSDKGRRLREELFNGLEGFTYRVRDLLSDSAFASVTTSQQRSAIEKILGVTSDWLQEDGAQAGIDAIKEKLQSLRSLVDPVQRRKEETTKRPSAIAKLEQALKSATSLKESVSVKLAQAAESAASSLAAAASSTVESAASSATESISPESSESTTDDDLEIDEDDTAATLSSLAAKFSAYIDPWSYTETDLTKLTSAFDTATEWLAEKLSAQNSLKDSDEPAFLSADVEKQVESLSKIIEELQRKAKFQSRASASSTSSSKKAAKSKTSKTKSSSKSTSSAKVTDSAAADAAESQATSESGDPSPKEEDTKIRDEL